MLRDDRLLRLLEDVLWLDALLTETVLEERLLGLDTLCVDWLLALELRLDAETVDGELVLTDDGEDAVLSETLLGLDKLDPLLGVEPLD